MAYPQQAPKSSNEALVQQQKSQQEYDKNGQHLANCEFRERGSEPWPQSFLKYTLMERVLMERYMLQNRGEPFPATWRCPLPSCHEQFDTFPHAIMHLEDCKHLTPNTNLYTCPRCQADVDIPFHTCPSRQTVSQVPATGHGKKTTLKLKIKKSLESLLPHSSPRASPSVTRSSPLSTLSSESGCSQEKETAMPVPHEADVTKPNVPELSSYSQNNKNFPIDPLITNCLPGVHEAYSDVSCLSSTVTDSSCESGLRSIFSPQAASSVANSSQFTWPSPMELPSTVPSTELPCLTDPNVSLWAGGIQPHSNVHDFGALPFGPAVSELPGHALLQGTAGMEDLMPYYFELDSNIDVSCSGVEDEYLGDSTSLPQGQWVHQEELPLLKPELQGDSPPQYYTALQSAANAVPSHELPTPASDFAMTGTTPSSDGASPDSGDSALPQCPWPQCGWTPVRGKRSAKKLRMAVDKHYKRNHQSRDHYCKICFQCFKNRLDNVKPHVHRKHRDRYAELYPNEAAQQDGGAQGGDNKPLVSPARGRQAR